MTYVVEVRANIRGLRYPLMFRNWLTHILYLQNTTIGGLKITPLIILVKLYVYGEKMPIIGYI